jgi:hypothetical protein
MISHSSKATSASGFEMQPGDVVMRRRNMVPANRLTAYVRVQLSKNDLAIPNDRDMTRLEALAAMRLAQQRLSNPAQQVSIIDAPRNYTIRGAPDDMDAELVLELDLRGEDAYIDEDTGEPLTDPEKIAQYASSRYKLDKRMALRTYLNDHGFDTVHTEPEPGQRDPDAPRPYPGSTTDTFRSSTTSLRGYTTSGGGFVVARTTRPAYPDPHTMARPLLSSWDQESVTTDADQALIEQLLNGDIEVTLTADTMDDPFDS